MSILCTTFVLVMSNALSNIEKAFLSLPAVANGLGIAEIKKLVKVEESSKAKAWEHTKKIAKQVAKAHAWWKSPEGKEVMESEGIDWNVERFYEALGMAVADRPWGKSNGNRLKNVGQLEDSVVAAYDELVASDPEKHPRDAKELLKWAKTGSTSAEGEEGEEGSEAATTLVSIAVKGQEGEKGYSIRILSSGEIVGYDKLAEFILLLNESMTTAANGKFAPTITEDVPSLEGWDDLEDDED